MQLINDTKISVSWSFGRVVRLFTGKQGVVRVAKVKTMVWRVLWTWVVLGKVLFVG